MTRGPAGEPAPGLPSVLVAGALLAPLLAVAIAALLSLPPLADHAGVVRPLLARALSPAGWIGLPVLGAGLGTLASLARSGIGRHARLRLPLAVALCVLGAVLLARPSFAPPPRGGPPRGARAKAQEILRAAFRSPATIAGILHYTRDPDPVVREQATLALGVNLLVAGIEHDTPARPSPYTTLPLRDSLRVRLQAALTDPAEGVRAEAARALWKAPRTFGPQPAAAETLEAILGRATRPAAVERLAWLALDAAAGAPDPRLKSAAARFAAATPDSELARAARLAAGP